jgi:hypothetical protein
MRIRSLVIAGTAFVAAAAGADRSPLSGANRKTFAHFEIYWF